MSRGGGVIRNQMLRGGGVGKNFRPTPIVILNGTALSLLFLRNTTPPDLYQLDAIKTNGVGVAVQQSSQICDFWTKLTFIKSLKYFQFTSALFFGYFTD